MNPPPELAWFKSSYSSGSSDPDCVEVAHTPGTAHIRDSKNPPHGPQVTANGTAWAAFVTYARSPLVLREVDRVQA
ncbi:DUF397 domain-containing protein [Streptomyces sp. NPDC102406]|uniref:DUF397 domain-containing protein n=1 Tax=Streptomyces sp. NPDC102406 TaxID=3366171 RepID=UPI003810953C